MISDATLTIRLKPDIEKQLVRLSQTTNRTPSVLVAEAIATYVARETDIIDGIHRGLADMQAGRLVAHEDAMAELDAAIDAIERGNG